MIVIHKPKFIFNGILCLSLAFQAATQGLQIGDRCPNIELKNILNFSEEKTTLSRFRGKAVVLDFWSSWCLNCIKEFPRLDSLQQVFGDELQIILVTKERKSKAIQVFRRYPSLANVKLVSIVEDTLLSLLFPYIGLPHQVWLDGEGVVQAITDGRFASVENLNLLIQGRSLPGLPVKADNLSYGIGGNNLPLITHGYEENKKKIFYYSYLSGHRPELISGYSVPKTDRLSGFTQVSATNVTVKDLYRLAYRETIIGGDPQVILLFNDTTRLRPDYQGNGNIFCYELIARDTSHNKFLNQMKQDLDAHFNILSQVLKIPMECLILKRTTKDDWLKAKERKPPVTYTENGFIVFKSVPFFNVVKYTLEPLLKLPLFDETEYHGRIDINLPTNVENVEALNTYLSMYGLTLKKETRIIQAVGLLDK